MRQDRGRREAGKVGKVKSGKRARGLGPWRSARGGARAGVRGGELRRNVATIPRAGRRIRRVAAFAPPEERVRRGGGRPGRMVGVEMCRRWWWWWWWWWWRWWRHGGGVSPVPSGGERGKAWNWRRQSVARRAPQRRADVGVDFFYSPSCVSSSLARTRRLVAGACGVLSFSLSLLRVSSSVAPSRRYSGQRRGGERRPDGTARV